MATEVDHSGDTFLDQFRGLELSGSVLSVGNVISDTLTGSSGACYQSGTFPTADVTTYLECTPNPSLVLKPSIRKCPSGYVYSHQTSGCVRASAVDLLRHDLGYRVGPSGGSQTVTPGSPAPFDVNDFIGAKVQCQTSGPNALLHEDRVYLHCRGPADKGRQ